MDFRGDQREGWWLTVVQEDDQSAHTITQRLRQLKRIPPELLPLGVVIAYVNPGFQFECH
jgi:hypothetical protein